MTFVPDPVIHMKLRRAVQEGVNAYLLTVSRAMRETLSKKGMGRLYKVGKGKKNSRNLRESGYHRASHRGAPPAPDTGALRRSWQVGRGLQGGTGGVAFPKGSDEFTPSRRKRRPVTAEARQALLTVISNGNVIGYRFGSALKYARIDRGWGRVKPRPYVEPTMAMTRDLFEPIMATALRRHFGGPPRA
jgi:hypothetical protein